MRITFPRLGGLAGLALVWAQSYQAATLYPEKPPSLGGKIAAVLLAPWYSSFKISQLTPYNKPENKVWHTLGKVLCPFEYTAFQLSQMKSQNTGVGEKILSVILGPIYSIYAADQIKSAKRQAIMPTLAQSATFQAISVPPPLPNTMVNYSPSYSSVSFQPAIVPVSNQYKRPLSL